LACIQPGEIWEVRPDPSAPWRRVRVIHVFWDVVEFQFLDLRGCSEFGMATETRMLQSDDKYRFVSPTQL
jgi:hypothetical protein